MHTAQQTPLCQQLALKLTNCTLYWNPSSFVSAFLDLLRVTAGVSFLTRLWVKVDVEWGAGRWEVGELGMAGKRTEVEFCLCSGLWGVEETTVESLSTRLRSDSSLLDPELNLWDLLGSFPPKWDTLNTALSSGSGRNFFAVLYWPVVFFFFEGCAGTCG